MKFTRSLVATFAVLLLAAPAFAARVDGTSVLYVGGSIAQPPEGRLGRLDITVTDALVFDYAGGTLSIPYGSMQRFEYTVPLARRLGGLATVAVVLVKYRQRRHIIEVQFRDSSGATQVMVFEVSKDRAKPVVAVLNAKVPRPAPQAAQPGRSPNGNK
jgi:hypothetical protein